MTWLIILVIVLVVIGPIMYLVPNAADKRLTALRMTARKLGLSVQITNIAKLDPEDRERVTAGGRHLDPRIACVAYRLPVGEKLRDVGAVMLMKIPSAPTVPVDEVIDGWALAPDSNRDFWQRYSADGAAAATFASITCMLPDDVLAIAVDARTVSCYWRERPPADSAAVASIAAALNIIREDLVRRFVVRPSSSGGTGNSSD